MRSCAENDYFRSGVVIYFDNCPIIGCSNYFLMQRNPIFKKEYNGVARMGWLYEGVMATPVKTLREGILRRLKGIAQEAPERALKTCAGTITIACGERKWTIPFPKPRKKLALSLSNGKEVLICAQ